MPEKPIGPPPAQPKRPIAPPLPKPEKKGETSPPPVPKPSIPAPERRTK